MSTAKSNPSLWNKLDLSNKFSADSCEETHARPEGPGNEDFSSTFVKSWLLKVSVKTARCETLERSVVMSDDIVTGEKVDFLNGQVHRAHPSTRIFNCTRRLNDNLQGRLIVLRQGCFIFASMRMRRRVSKLAVFSGRARAANLEEDLHCTDGHQNDSEPSCKMLDRRELRDVRECLKCVDSVKMTPALNLGAAMASTRGHCSERRPPERENKERKWVRSWREGGRSVGRRSGHPEMNKH